MTELHRLLEQRRLDKSRLQKQLQLVEVLQEAKAAEAESEFRLREADRDMKVSKAACHCTSQWLRVGETVGRAAICLTLS